MVNTPSPLRYPGGKTILYDRIKNIMLNNKLKNCIYIEPFAGGAGLALKLLFNDDVDRIIINDFDYAIYSFWYCVLFETERLCKDIKRTRISLKQWEKQKMIYENKDFYSIYEVGFATLFLNRTNRSGIIQGGPIGGKKQDGKYKIGCRFNKESLIDKILKISQYKEKIDIYNLDANDLIEKVIKNYKSSNSFTYFDPPYINKGPALYKNHFSKDDHALLAKNINKYLKNKNWIVTYDNNELVYELYHNYSIEEYSLNYSAGINKRGNELMVFGKRITNF